MKQTLSRIALSMCVTCYYGNRNFRS